MICRYPKVLVAVDIVNMKKIANGSATYPGTFQDNVDQMNEGCRTTYSEPHQISTREHSSELSTPKSGYLFPQKTPSQIFGKALDTPLTLVIFVRFCKSKL